MQPIEEIAERITELVENAPLNDPMQAQRWAHAAREQLALLTAQVKAAVEREGGTFGRALRAALEKQIVTQLAGTCVLTDQVTEHSVNVHLLGPETGHVLVDVRLRIEKGKQA